MSYLRFDKAQMANLQESLPKEVLRSNRSGAYSCSSVVDCNTRKYHGLLVVPVPEIDDDNHVLLSSLDETVIQHGAQFNLAVHKYSGDVYNPNGHKYIREFTWEKLPTTLYRVGGVILKKERVFQHYENRFLIRYTLLDAHSVTTLRLRPFLAFRSVKECTHENSNASREYQEIDCGIKTCMYKGYPELYMQTSKKADYVFDPNWYHGIEYYKERELGYEYCEDLYVPGYFEFNIKKGESVVFAAGLNELEAKKLTEIFDHEYEVHVPRESFQSCLINAAHQFHYEKDNENYIVAGFPWFKCRARDMFISLPGLTLAIDEVDYYEKAMCTAEKAIRDYIAGRPISVKMYEFDKPDILLWATWCIQQYARLVSFDEMVRKYGELLTLITDFIKEKKHPDLHLEENGLLYANGRDHAITWMNSEVNGNPVVPRSGYIVEFNALWYNALVFGAEVLGAMGRHAEAESYSKLAELSGKSFKEVFLNHHGYLLDYVEKDFISWSVRPNMLIASSLEYTPLTTPEKKKIFDICTKELLTPKGIRSLSPKSGGYTPVYEGGQVQRDSAYHQGTAWPWLSGFYLETCLKVYKHSGLAWVDRHFLGLEEEMYYHGIGSIPELFDGNPPFHGRGAISFAMNVAAILRVNKVLAKYYNY